MNVSHGLNPHSPTTEGIAKIDELTKIITVRPNTPMVFLYGCVGKFLDLLPYHNHSWAYSNHSSDQHS